MSPDGELIFQESAPKTDADLMLLRMPGTGWSGTRDTLSAESYREVCGEISPDGHWLAYQSNESGRNEIYVRPFPVPGERRWPVSVGGGVKPLWARDGRELFYLNGTSLMSVRVQTTPLFSAANPTKMFDGQYFAGITRPDLRRVPRWKALPDDQERVHRHHRHSRRHGGRSQLDRRAQGKIQKMNLMLNCPCSPA